MGGQDASVPVDAGGDDHLDDVEMRAALASLTNTDWLRLAKVDARYRGGTDFRDGDLVQEALCRAIAGKRKCPRGIPVVKFLADAIWSIAGHRRSRMLAEVSFEASPPTAVGEQTEGLAPADVLFAPGEDPETLLAKAEGEGAIRDLIGLFPGDGEVELVVAALSLGLKGADLYEETGLAPNRVHYVIRKIRNESDKRFPGRWTR
jgi:hypothetical protein